MGTCTQCDRIPPRVPGPWLRAIPCLLGVLLLAPGCRQQSRLRVVIPRTAPILDIAAREVAARLRQGGYRVEIASGPGAGAGQVNAIVLNVDDSLPGLQPEGFQIVPIQTSGFLLLRVTGHDLRGALWGALEAADQIVSGGRLEAIRKTRGNRFLKVRASLLPLPLLGSSVSKEAQMQARDLWRQHLDLLLRNRFNSIFFQTGTPLSRYTNFPAKSLIPSSSAGESGANMAWLHDLFRMAEDRGLNSYLLLSRSSLEELFVKTNGSGQTTPQPAASPADAERGLPQALPSILGTYPELAGVALDEDVTGLSAEDRGAWVAENFLAPLAQEKERRPVFLSADKWWPSQNDFGGAGRTVPVYLLAPFQRLDEAPSDSDFPVLWRVDKGAPDLQPWQDPNAVRKLLARMGATNSLGFLEDSYPGFREQSEEDSGPGKLQRPTAASNWFQLMLWGRLGYAPDVSNAYWEQQFALRFGNRAGHFVYAAAVNSSQVLAMLRAEGGTFGSIPPSGGPNRLPGAAAGFPVSEQHLFQLISDPQSQDFLNDALRKLGLLLAEEGKSPRQSSVAVAEAVEQKARQAWNDAERAAPYGAWEGADNEDFYRRIRHVAGQGLVQAENLRATAALALFVLGGKQDDRQQAIEHLQQARQALAEMETKSPEGKEPGSAAELSSQINRTTEFSRQAQPWRWQKTTWEVGVIEQWQPASQSDVPTPRQWQRLETSRLSEFGFYGRQPRMSFLNQQLRPAFLPAEAFGEAISGGVLVGKTRVAAKREGRLVLRVVADRPSSVWVNRRRATRLSQRRFPWVPASQPDTPYRLQLLSAPVQPGDNEVIVAASAQDRWPLISVNFLLAPEDTDATRMLARDAARLEGGILSLPGTDAFPQPHITLPDEASDEPSAISRRKGSAHALYRVPIQNPGFYRLRLWCYWRTAESRGLDLVLDGLSLQEGLGVRDATFRRWHWQSTNVVADLGAGEHTLTISGWKPGALVGIVEVFPAW